MDPGASLLVKADSQHVNLEHSRSLENAPEDIDVQARVSPDSKLLLQLDRTSETGGESEA